MLASGSSKAKLIAGANSVIKSIVKRSNGFNPNGIAIDRLIKIGKTSGVICVIVYVIDFFKLSNKTRPSLIPIFIKKKLKKYT